MMLRAYHGRVVPATTHRVAEAVEALRRGKIIALPTDTLYGLAAGVRSESGVRVSETVLSRSRRIMNYDFAGFVCDQTAIRGCASCNLCRRRPGSRELPGNWAPSFRAS
jgi:hypothetical protein